MKLVPTKASAMDSFGFSQFCISQALKESVSDIRGTLEGSSLKVFPSIVKVSLSLKLTLKVFQDCVEVHMQHIQQGLRLEIVKAINGDVNGDGNFNIHSLFIFSMMGNLTKFMEQPSLSLQN